MSTSLEDRGVPLKLAMEAMGTRFELVLVDDGSRPSAELRAAGEQALDEIRACELRYSAFRRDSERTRVVREATQQGGTALGADFAALFALCRELCRASDGAFDPGLPAGLAAWDLDLGSRRARCRAALPALDFGAVAKGWALDHAAAALQEAGITRALLHGGTSSIVALGAPPGCAGWAIALRDPTLGSEAAPLARVELRDLALGVSAPHGRRDAAGHGHVLDPRDGRSAETPLACALHPSAAIADAWSTALLVRASRAWAKPADADSIAAPLAPWHGEEPSCLWLPHSGAQPLRRGPRAEHFVFP
ncbi:MAG: FAD:protein FMN transferase [Planctomycetes bacterium]|nr:FAD:protein FMN transferase [Planctomycetota bacterium]